MTSTTEIMTRFREMIASFKGELSEGENEFARKRAIRYVKKWAGLEEPHRTNFAILSLSILRVQRNQLRFRKELWITVWWLAMTYKKILPPERWDAFLDDFSWNPALADDLVERERQRAWNRQRHLVAVWDAAG